MLLYLTFFPFSPDRYYKISNNVSASAFAAAGEHRIQGWFMTTCLSDSDLHKPPSLVAGTSGWVSGWLARRGGGKGEGEGVCEREGSGTWGVSSTAPYQIQVHTSRSSTPTRIQQESASLSATKLITGLYYIPRRDSGLIEPTMYDEKAWRALLPPTGRYFQPCWKLSRQCYTLHTTPQFRGPTSISDTAIVLATDPEANPGTKCWFGWMDRDAGSGTDSDYLSYVVHYIYTQISRHLRLMIQDKNMMVQSARSQYTLV